MGSNPNKFLPSHWFKAARRQFIQTQSGSSSSSSNTVSRDEKVTSVNKASISDHSSQQMEQAKSTSRRTSGRWLRSNSAACSDTNHLQDRHQSKLHPSTVSSLKTRNSFFSKKFFHTSLQRQRKPYHAPKKQLQATNQSDFSSPSSPSNQVLNGDINASKIESMKRPSRKNSPDSSCSLQTQHDPKGVLTIASSQSEVHKQVSCSNELKEHSGIHDVVSKDSNIQQDNENQSNKTLESCNEIKASDKPRVAKKLSRAWVTVSRPNGSKKFSKAIGTCSVMSYNILSQTLLELNDFLYRDCDEHALPWTFRWSNIKKELEHFYVDIMCLQEVEEANYHDSLKPWLDANGYTYAYKRRTGDDENKPDGVLTACLVGKYEIVDTVQVEYFRSFDRLTKWHNVGLIVILKMRGKLAQETPFICVANTHLVYNPNRGDVKLVQLATFFAEIDKVTKMYNKKTGYPIPIVVCGDFNSTPFSHIFDFITSGTLYYDGLCTKHMSGQKVYKAGVCLPEFLLPEGLKMRENCTFIEDDEADVERRSHFLSHNLGPLSSSGDRHVAGEASTTQDKGITVDYIFYSDHQKVQPTKVDDFPSTDASIASESTNEGVNSKDTFQTPKYNLELDRRLSMCTGWNIFKAKGLPNTFHPSDHLPIIANFSVLINEDE